MSKKLKLTPHFSAHQQTRSHISPLSSQNSSLVHQQMVQTSPHRPETVNNKWSFYVAKNNHNALLMLGVVQSCLKRGKLLIRLGSSSSPKWFTGFKAQLKFPYTLIKSLERSLHANNSKNRNYLQILSVIKQGC